MGHIISEEYENRISDFDRFYIFTVLYEGPTHGYGILRKFQNRLKKKGSPGIVYPFLQQLEKRGLVTSKKELHGDRERKIYALTPEGRRFCEGLFKRFSSIVSIAIEPSLEKCSHCGCTLYEGSHQEFIAGAKLIFCCPHCARAYKTERGLVVDTPEAEEQKVMVE
jgi:DNA-binding PadR family transcriptional regulator